jgi:hypothetical protein
MIPEKSKISTQLRFIPAGACFAFFAGGAMGADRALRTATYQKFG